MNEEQYGNDINELKGLMKLLISIHSSEELPAYPFISKLREFIHINEDVIDSSESLGNRLRAMGRKQAFEQVISMINVNPEWMDGVVSVRT